MKQYAFAILASAVLAETFHRPTENECFMDEDAEKTGDCMSLFYNECTAHKMEPSGTCNFMALSDSEINY